MIKYFAHSLASKGRMTRCKFENAINDKILNSKFDNLIDTIVSRVNETINFYINSTCKSFDYIINKGCYISTGFSQRSECFTIDNHSYYPNNEYESNGSSEFRISISRDYHSFNKAKSDIIIDLYDNGMWYDGNHVGVVVDKKLSRCSFNNIIKNLVKYYLAMYVHDEEDLNGFDGIDSMEVQNILNLTSIDSLP